MKTKYIVLSETNHYGWVANFATLKEARRLLTVENEIFYIFKYAHKKEPFLMKIRYPFGEYYDCLSIYQYMDEVFEDDDEYDDYVCITYDNSCGNDCLVITHKS